MKNGKTCFGVIIGTRAYFNSELAKDVRKQLLKTLDEGGYEYIILPELISLENMRLKFYACKDVEDAEENATLVVGVLADPADATTFVALDTIVLTSSTYAQS